ncbi:uncharacterized protein DUF397 [Herbihabitans rhizosphaerae]|uniref:Uncharacterized protein DUF397 n=1 Tax=Herbihabitans rhizosphaerae TaxID=1872711 RepID=A0A4Q7KY65_9PSEU|nr:DUF397 domain-containing protein [Herbihabitans rhizosphaerae]RZS40961.1 uncharacterized protein DUF397 [Herbihabitans rhizosphaerae]
MIAPEPASLVWHKSSFSGNGGDCVEVAHAGEGVAIRDSKNPDGLILAVPSHAWHPLVANTFQT